VAKTENKPAIKLKGASNTPKAPRAASKPFLVIGRYLKGSWQELKQVRWPNRKSTWSMMLAVLIFSGFFVALIKLLDIGFDELFKLVIK
jgi:preprotein translocase subunit SecE